uniref:C2H2-type domain-containing protein n=1 Tax=Meloidogyne incognita TaxID=6306 RepID=A0A914KJW2_MELIC
MADPRAKVPCDVCGLKVPNGRMKGHLFECQAMHPFPCGLCTRGFSSQQGVANHQSLSHSAEERGTRFRCTHSDCDFGTNYHKHLETHLQKHLTGFRRSRSRSRSRSRQPGGNPYTAPQLNQPPLLQPQEGQQQVEEECVEMENEYFPRTVGRSADRNVRRNVDRSQMPVLQKMEKIQQPKIRQSRSRSRSRAKRSKASKPNRPAQMPREDQQQYEEEIEVEYRPQTVGRAGHSKRNPQIDRSNEPEVQQLEQATTSTASMEENIQCPIQEPEIQQIEQVVNEEAAIVTIDDDEEIGPLPGFTNLQLVDPVKARMIMAAESKSLDDLVRNLRENNNILHQFCLERGLDYGTQNTANAIDVYFRNFSVHDEFNDYND